MSEILDPQPKEIRVKGLYTVFIMETPLADDDSIRETEAFLQAAVEPTVIRHRILEINDDPANPRLTRHVLEWRAYFIHKRDLNFIPTIDPSAVDPR